MLCQLAFFNCPESLIQHKHASLKAGPRWGYTCSRSLTLWDVFTKSSSFYFAREVALFMTIYPEVSKSGEALLNSVIK